mmetsp:Transcript_12583/g.29176  ORF Transcript_12583/g.29176 Transcript_12583/m.29176 type:complete len:116 (-) Transcript_12583:1343-1690(-)
MPLFGGGTIGIEDTGRNGTNEEQIIRRVYVVLLKNCQFAFASSRSTILLPSCHVLVVVWPAPPPKPMQISVHPVAAAEGSCSVSHHGAAKTGDEHQFLDALPRALSINRTHHECG